MKTVKLFLIASLLMTSNFMRSQSTGTIKGSVTDDKKKPMLFMAVGLLDDSTIVNTATTDENGNYTFKQITPGNYTLSFSCPGFIPKKIKEVSVDPVQVAYVYVSLTPTNDTLPIVEVVTTFEKPIINPLFSTMTPIRIEQIEKMPVSKGDIIGLITAVTPQVLASEDGSELYVGGTRNGSTQFIIDGNKIMGSPNVPGMGIAGMEVITGGIPAEYGDCTGGVVIITTKEYKWEMRRKEMERRARKEREELQKQAPVQ
jgi:hypothetical protein